MSRSESITSVNGEVRGIYVLARISKCFMVIVDWLVCIADVSGLGFDGDVLLVGSCILQVSRSIFPVFFDIIF